MIPGKCGKKSSARHRARLLPFVFICMLAWSHSLFANAPLRLGADAPYDLFVDSDGTLTIEQAAKLPSNVFESRSRPLAEGYRQATFWLRLTLPAKWFDNGELWLELFPPFLDSVTVYQRSLGSTEAWRQETLGDHFPATDRSIDARLPVFALRQQGPEPLEVFIRLQTTSSVLLEGRLFTPAGFTSQALKDAAYWGFYFGMALLSTLFAVAVTLVMGSRTMLAVSLFSLSYLLVASVQGMLGWLVFRHHPWVADHLTSLSVFVTSFLIILVIREALHLKENFPRLDRWIQAAMALMLLSMLGIPLSFFGPAISFTMLLSHLLVIPLVIAGLLLWRRQGLTYGLVTLAYLLLSLATSLSLLTVLGVMPLHQEIYLLWQYLLIVLMLLVTGISIYRVWLENREKRNRESLERALRQEQQAGARQRQFLGMISHELRTPLAVISASATNLAAALPQKPGSEQRRLQKIQKAVDRLNQLTENFLAQARLESQLDLADVRPVDLVALLQDVIDSLAYEDKHRFRWWLSGQEQPTDSGDRAARLLADEDLLRIAFSNVIDNALKYSPPGEIALRLDKSGSYWRLAVINGGPAIPPELQSRIFEPYVRGTQAQEPMSASGAGLGLYIARLIARQHNGDLTLRSEEPEGTVLVFTLPKTLQSPLPNS